MGYATNNFSRIPELCRQLDQGLATLLSDRSNRGMLRVHALAETHGTSHDTFAKNLAQATGMSPKESVTRRFNQQAIHLVIHFGLKMKEIADRLGFSDEFYFSRFFQRRNRVAPTAYRQRFRSGG